MSKLCAGMTVSLDGFAADPSGEVGALYADSDVLRNSAYMDDLIAETGAVLMGRRTFDMAGDPDAFADSYEFQVPIFVLTHQPPATPPKQNDRLTFSFETDGLERAVDHAKSAAGDHAVTVVGGISVIRDLLLAGHVDELHIDIMPVLLGDGIRLLDGPLLRDIRVEKRSVREFGDRTAMRFRVLQCG